MIQPSFLVGHYFYMRYGTELTSVVDPHHLDTDPDANPDSTYHPDADSVSDYLMRIRMRIFI